MNNDLTLGQFLIAFAIFLLAFSIFISSILVVGKFEEMISVAIQLVGVINGS